MTLPLNHLGKNQRVLRSSKNNFPFLRDSVQWEMGHHLCSSAARTQDPAQPAAKSPKAQDTVLCPAVSILWRERSATQSLFQQHRRERAPGTGEQEQGGIPWQTCRDGQSGQAKTDTTDTPTAPAASNSNATYISVYQKMLL